LYKDDVGATLDHSPMTLGKTNEENLLWKNWTSVSACGWVW
jgi:hypothetical protein